MEYVLLDPVTAGRGALAVGAALLLVISVVTARRTRAAVPGLDGYFDRWRAVHGGYDPREGSVWVRGWLATMYRMARPLAGMGVAPHALTAWNVWLSVAAVVAAIEGGSWLLVAGFLVLSSGVADSLDGAVAVLTDRATRWGYVVDSVADRVGDVLLLVALFAAGAPAWLAALCGVALLLLEYLRARAANAGATEIGTVTVGERVNRIAVTAATLYVGGLVPDRLETVAAVGLALLTVLSLVGLGQLAVAVRGQLRE